MPEPIVCKRVRGMVGCGHPVAYHTGPDAQLADCCCCSRNQNLPGHLERCVDCQIRRIKFEHPEPLSAEEVAERMPTAELRQLFWRRALERWMTEQGFDIPEEEIGA